ncbi:DUF4157 domain-containing protein [Actinomadura oligospora]|uniref:eCIS core domain-containing protein n=1 Tax=Actinomadura oligospora TaxID=111804 RepID=UPI0004BA2B66|nr:DUF4157 domain-containing protein [Actinomadura oligospora]
MQDRGRTDEAHRHAGTPPAHRPGTSRRHPVPDGPVAAALIRARGLAGVSAPQLSQLQRLVGNAAISRSAEEERHVHDASCGHAVQRTAVHQALSSPGRPLAADVRQEMEGRLGADFSDVRVHTDSTGHTAAESVNAHAFTSGSHIVFQRGRYDAGSASGKRMLAHELTHVIQQRSGPVAGTDAGDGLKVSDPSDRFEREAEANAVRAMSGEPVQRLEDEGSATGPRRGGGSVQRMKFSPGTGGRGVAGWVANEGAEERERELTEKHGIDIGSVAGGPRMSHSMLYEIDKVLGELPEDHVRGNPFLRSIQMGDGLGQASAYDSRTQRIGMVNPFGMPAFMYTSLNRGSRAQRGLMDMGAALGYDGLTTGEQLGVMVPGTDRHVMGGVSDVLANGNLVKWTLRHEIGHSVDRKVGWALHLSSRPEFGGWRREHRAGIVEALATRFGFAPEAFAAGTSLEPDALREHAANLDGHFAGCGLDDERRGQVVGFVRKALAQPWMLNDGGRAHLEVGGRIYHVDHYDAWVSYEAAARGNAVSNYQFSTPDEWFAEAYAAYYDPKGTSRARLSNEVRRWFATELGERDAETAASTAPPTGTCAHAPHSD